MPKRNDFEEARTINWSEFVELVSQRAKKEGVKITKRTLTEAGELFFNEMEDLVAQGKRVRLYQQGFIYPAAYSAVQARNINNPNKTNEIPAGRRLYFKPSASFKQHINSPKFDEQRKKELAYAKSKRI